MCITQNVSEWLETSQSSPNQYHSALSPTTRSQAFGQPCEIIEIPRGGKRGLHKEHTKVGINAFCAFLVAQHTDFRLQMHHHLHNQIAFTATQTSVFGMVVSRHSLAGTFASFVIAGGRDLDWEDKARDHEEHAIQLEELHVQG